MSKKGRPADKDEYLNIVLNIMDSGPSHTFASDLLDSGFSKMTCLELALVACKLGYQSEELPNRTEAQRDRIEIIENSVVNFE